MLGNLLCTGCVNDAKVRLYNDIRHARICGWVAEALRDQILAGDDVEDFARGLCFVQVCDSGGSVTGILEEDEGDIVRL